MYMNRFGEILALTTPTQPGAGQPAPSPLMTFLPMVLIAVVFYFILIRPQQLRAKQLRKLVDSIKAGDRVVTASGIVGVVVSIKEKDRTITLRSSDAKFEVTKASITEVVDSATTTEA